MQRRTATRATTALAVLAVLALALTGCGGQASAAARDEVLKVAYQRFGDNAGLAAYWHRVEQQFERAHPGVDVQLVPVVAQGNDYFTKVNLMRGASRTAPDVVVQDTFQIDSDVQAGYFRPLDARLRRWRDWPQFAGSEQAVTAGDGKVYAVPNGTDSRGLFYNKAVLRRAGVTVPWRPRTWQDVLDAARKVKEAVPGVIPLNVYASSTVGEVTTMQGLEMLLYGTGDTLYDQRTHRWVTASPGLESSFDFIRTVSAEGLGPPPGQALDPQLQTLVSTQLLPKGQLAIALDGNFIARAWAEGGSSPWPQATKVLGVAPMPTQDGQGKGATSMSGGFALGVSTTAPDPDLAFDFITTAADEENSVAYCLAVSNLTVRKDAAQDPRYLKGAPFVTDFTRLLAVRHYRPTYPAYPRVSNEVQTAMESVMTGDRSPRQAMGDYADAVSALVGSSRTERARTAGQDR